MPVTDDLVRECHLETAAQSLSMGRVKPFASAEALNQFGAAWAARLVAELSDCGVAPEIAQQVGPAVLSVLAIAHEATRSAYVAGFDIE